MNRFLMAALTAGALIVPGTGMATDATNEDTADLLNICSHDMQTYCATVTPGKGRLLACMAAHQDKLRPACLNALYDRAESLQALSNSLSILGRSCGQELDVHCSNVEPGQGRVAGCLKENQAKLTPICREAARGLGILN